MQRLLSVERYREKGMRRIGFALSIFDLDVTLQLFEVATSVRERLQEA